MKSSVYETFGFSILCEMLAQQILSISCDEGSLTSHFDFIEIKKSALKYISRSIERSSDSLLAKDDFMQDLDDMCAVKGQFRR